MGTVCVKGNSGTLVPEKAVGYYFLSSYQDGIDHLLLAHDCCAALPWQAFMEEQTKQNVRLFRKENKRWRQELKGLNQQGLLQQGQQSPVLGRAAVDKQMRRVRELEITNKNLRQELESLKEQQLSTAPGQAVVAAQDGVVEVPQQSQQHRLVRPLSVAALKL